MRSSFFLYCTFILSSLPVLLLGNLPVFAQVITGDLETHLKKNGIQDYKKSKDGIFYTVEKEGRGEQPRLGQYIKLHYTGKLLSGHKFDSSIERNEPFVFQLGQRRVILGWEYGIPLLKEGSKATLYVPSHLAYGEYGAGAIPANAHLVFNIDFLEILSPEGYDAYMVELENKEKDAFEAKKKKQRIADREKIKNYVAQKKLRTKVRPSGLNYIISDPGKGFKPKDGQELTVLFKGSLLNGKVFEDSFKAKKPFSFILGQNEVIKGWEEGMKLLGKGGKATFILPSELGYGAMPIDDLVPAYSVLIFEVEMLDIKSVEKK